MTGRSQIVLVLVLSASTNACSGPSVAPAGVSARLASAGICVKRMMREPDGTYLFDPSESEVSDLSVLKRIPVSSLDIHKTEMEDLSPLEEMPVRSLVACKSKVRDLDPLKRMPLQTLKVSHTQVRGLSPLREAPLKTLWIHETRVTDLGPLAGMRLTEVRFSPGSITGGLEVLDQMESLIWINQLPAAVFRRRTGSTTRSVGRPR